VFEIVASKLALEVLQWSPVMRGITFVLVTVTSIVILLSFQRLASRMSDTQLFLGCMYILATSCATLAILRYIHTSIASLMYLLSIFAVYAIAYPLAHTAVLGTLEKHNVSRFSSVLQGWAFIAENVGIACVSSIYLSENNFVLNEYALFMSSAVMLLATSVACKSK